ALHVRAVPLLERKACRCKEALRKAHRVQQRRMPIARQHAREHRSGPAHALWQAIEVAMVMVAEIPAVTAEQLVAAHTQENDGYLPARKLRYQVRGDEGRVGDRLVEMP